MGYHSDAGSSDSYSEADDSDADPNYILPGEERGARTSAVQNQDSDESEDDDTLLELDLDENEAEQNISQDSLPEFFCERTTKTKAGPPNAWRSAPPPVQVRTPGRNIIRTGLPEVRGAARALGSKPTKTQLWNLLFDDTC